MSDYEYYRYYDDWSRSNSASRLPNFDPFFDQSSYVPNPERQALWNSLSLREKIIGTLLSLLVGGGTAFVIGYVLT